MRYSTCNEVTETIYGRFILTNKWNQEVFWQFRDNEITMIHSIFTYRPAYGPSYESSLDDDLDK